MPISNQTLLSDFLYKRIESDAFTQVDDNVYILEKKDRVGDSSICMIVLGDIPDAVISSFHNKVDCLISLPPKDISSSVEGSLIEHSPQSTHIYADRPLYTQASSEAKSILLKPGHFLVEFLPEESATNYQYLFQVKEMARKAGMEYYAKVGWQKGDFVANTGRKSKNIEDVCFFTKGKARNLRPDAKKDKAEPGVEHYMSGAHGMLPSQFIFSPPSKKERIHQAEKPVELLASILNFVTLPGETALDQFAGSGVLGEAALKTGRNSILIEKDAETFQKLTERLQVLGNIQALTPAAEALVTIGTDAIVAQDAFQRTGDRDILYDFVKAHEIDPSVLYDGERDLRRDNHLSAEQQEVISKAFDAIEDVDLRAADLDLKPEPNRNDASPEDIENAPCCDWCGQKASQSSYRTLYEDTEYEQTSRYNECSDCAILSTKDLLDKVEKLQRSTEPKVLECSSRGDRRFSALFAKVTIKGKEKSIEEWYQEAKRTPEGKKAGKGKPFAYIVDPFTGDKLPAIEGSNLYKGLWITYLSKNPDLVEYASGFDEFHDMFKGKNTVNCQADVIAAYVRNPDVFVDEVKSSHWYTNMAGKKSKSLDKQIQSAEERRPEQVQQTSLFGPDHAFNHGH